MCAMCEEHLAGVAELSARLAAATQHTRLALAERTHEIAILKARLAKLEGAAECHALPSLAGEIEHAIAVDSVQAKACTEGAVHQPLSETVSSIDSCCKSLSTLCSTTASSRDCATPPHSLPELAAAGIPGPLLGPLPQTSSPLHAGNWPICKIRCSGGHELLAVPVQPQRGMRWICDGCERGHENFLGRSRFRCCSCDFDLCEDCYSWRVRLVTGSTCPRGHLLRSPSPSENTRRWICDGCEQDVAALPAASVSARRRCACCDYDVCGDCHSLAVSSPVDGRWLSLPHSGRRSCLSATIAAQPISAPSAVLGNPTSQAGLVPWATAAATSAAVSALAAAGSACAGAQRWPQNQVSCRPNCCSHPAAAGAGMGAAIVSIGGSRMCASHAAFGPPIGAVAGA